jgi:hypothetical protein
MIGRRYNPSGTSKDPNLLLWIVFGLDVAL